MIDTQTIGGWGMIVCVGLLLILITAENWLLKKRTKTQHDLILEMSDALKSANGLIELLRTTNTQYAAVLRQYGFIKDEEKPKLDG